MNEKIEIRCPVSSFYCYSITEPLQDRYCEIKCMLVRWYNVTVNSTLNEENHYERHRGNPHRA